MQQTNLINLFYLSYFIRYFKLESTITDSKDDSSKNKLLSPHNNQNNSSPLIENKNNKVKNSYHSLSSHSNKSNDYQNNSMELFGSLVGSYEVYLIELFIFIII